MTTDHNVDFPTSGTVGGWYDNTLTPLNEDYREVAFIKRVSLSSSHRRSDTIFEVSFYVDWEGEKYDITEAYNRAIAIAQGVLLLSDMWVKTAKPFRKANESLAHFWIRFHLVKGDK